MSSQHLAVVPICIAKNIAEQVHAFCFFFLFMTMVIAMSYVLHLMTSMRVFSARKKYGALLLGLATSIYYHPV